MARTKWIADAESSEVLFNTTHLLLQNITGYFKKIKLEIATEDDDFTKFHNIVFIAQTDSVDTCDNQRDNYLKSAGFFDSSRYPLLKFVGKKYLDAVEDDILLGTLTIKDITKPIELTIEFGGKTIEPDGLTRVAFSAQGKINRKHFDLNATTMANLGSLLIGEEVRFHAEIQLVKLVEEAVLKS
ncbi:YceI family protein [Dyadobacter sp. CY345]|uniref:YceI family protein n=1 Tax=Dyadobacter sp. CY345 TaxID=2909335 RepID=UPI001F2798C8|nr:YceI family protein [Dyadobacter sp. CY345]MCF2443597.1 YceI family protein [Dyadobacter sp. CY345]